VQTFVVHRIVPDCERLPAVGIAGRCAPFRQNGVWFMKLTLDTVRAITPVSPKTEIIVFDDDLPGFGVRARLSGWKIFIVQYSIGNRQRRVSLGDVDELDLDQARQRQGES
jgi:Arm DNA-binding domain